MRATRPKPLAAVFSRSLTREPSLRPTPSKTTRRPSLSAPMAATASSTPMCFRPNVPANTLRLSPAHPRLRPQPPPAQNRTPPRDPRTRLPARHSPPPTNRMTPNDTEVGRSTLPIHPDPARPENARPQNASLVQVSKLFGNFAALRQVSLDLEPGRCYVLLGENGAGKSTLLRILAGLLRPTHGTVSVFGESQPHNARARIGYMSHAPMLYDELTAA